MEDSKLSQKETEPTASPAADFDQQALDIIDAWEAGEYLHPVQKKAALQVAIRDALASPAEPEEKGACPVCGCEEVDHRNLWTCRCPAPAPGFKTVDPGRPYSATSPAPATDEEVARMVERLLHDCSRIGEPHDHMIMAQAADLLTRVARERDAAEATLWSIAHDGASKQGLKKRAARYLAGRTPRVVAILAHKLAAAEQRAEAAEKVLAIANRGGLDLLYAVRKAIGWTDKHALSLLPDECARLKKAAARNAPIWPGKDFDHSQPGGFYGPTGAD